MREFALRLVRSRAFLKGAFRVYTEEMSALTSPTIPSSLWSSYQLTVVAASVSSLVLFVVVVVVLSLIYRKDPLCCRPCSYQGPRADMDAPPQYYSSRQTLVGPSCPEPPRRSRDVSDGNAQLFFVGLPSSYGLPALDPPLPRLPSYESVRKKDRQRQIHMMIADRFGLNGPVVTEPPPTYEESVRQSVVLPPDILSSGPDASPHRGLCTDAQADTRRPVSCGSSGGALPLRGRPAAFQAPASP